MKKSIQLSDNWSIKKCEPADTIDPIQEALRDGWIAAVKMPAMVHDILLQNQVISDELLLGWCEDSLWVADFDWLYKCNFSGLEDKESYLIFQGLDTIADIYLNGRKIASHDDFYCSSRIEIGDDLQRENTLIVHFHNVKKILDTLELKPEWQGNMLKCKLLRKPVHDFPPEGGSGSEYQGSHPWFSPVGIYRDVILVYPGKTEFAEIDLRANLLELNKGYISFSASGIGNAEKMTVKLSISDMNGEIQSIQKQCVPENDGWNISIQIDIDNPQLWWPRMFGDQNLYTVVMRLFDDEKQYDLIEKKVGFRKIENPSDMEFCINEKSIRLYGGSMDPLQGYTHVWDENRARRMFDMVENANMNMLRIWGEGIPYPDDFYEEADRRGILIWQEFFMGHGSYPDTDEFAARVAGEARELVLRLRHHACVFMWCGGNETVMGAQQDFKPVFGENILTKYFPAVLKDLDPERYYHVSSPYGGDFANDPRRGDCHTYNCVLEYPYEEFPNFMSECIRTSPPVLHSLSRFVRGVIWPSEYDGKFRYEDIFPYPENWAERTCHGANGQIKTGPWWEYYDADNAEDHIYRFGMAYAKDLRNEIENCRTGSPDGNVPHSERVKGYCSCKLLDTWPKLYCAIIDFFQEAYIPYYATKRGLQPIMLSFRKRDTIRLWLVNDSALDFKGYVIFGIYHFATAKYLVKDRISVTMKQGESGIVFDLAHLHFFPKNVALTAFLYDENDHLMMECIDYVTEERRLKFPEAELSVTQKGNSYIIKTNTFARCVEILGDCDGDPFGWLFSDNYFDMLPDVPKVIQVIDGPKQGFLSFRPHYSKRTIRMEYKKN